MILDCLWTDLEEFCALFSVLALGNEFKNFPLANGKLIQWSSVRSGQLEGNCLRRC